MYNNKTSSFFVFLGFLVAMLCLSFGVSFFKNYYDYYKDKEEISKKTNIVNITFNQNITLENLSKKMTKVEGSIKFTSGDFMYSIDNRRIYVDGIYSTGQLSKDDYPLKEGRYLSKNETASTKKVAMIGFLLKDNCKKIDNKYFIEVEGEKYEVVGFIGRKTMSYWNNNIIVPINALPKKYSLQQAATIPFVFFNNNNNVYINNLKFDLKDILKDINIDNVSNEVTVTKIIDIEKSFYTSIGILIIIAIINILNFSNYWVESLKKSMAVQRVVGASSFDILIFIFKQVFIIALIALGCTFILHIWLESILSKVFMVQMQINLINLVIAFIFSILVCTLNSLFLLKRVLKFDKEIKNYI
jgi:putative ABC transport system permease protein